MDSFWRIIIKKIKSFLTLNATAAATPCRCPTVLVTKAGDGHTVSLFRLLPFSCYVFAQRLNLLTFLMVLKRPVDRLCPLSDLNNTQKTSPLPRKWHLYPCQRTAALVFFILFFLWLSQHLLKPSTCIDPPPIFLALPLIPHCSLVWNYIACLLLLIPEDWTLVSAPSSLVLY